MGYTNDELGKMTLEELKNVKISDMIENPPVRGLGFPYTVSYACKMCGANLEGSERTVRNKTKYKPVLCPYCDEILWDPNGKNMLRKSAFKPGHFDIERRKSYLKYLKDRSKTKDKIKIMNDGV